MDEAISYGLISLNTKGSGEKTKLKVKELTAGQMVGSTKDIGIRAICMVMVFIRGRMEGNTRGSMKMIKSMAKVRILGLMEGYIAVAGRMENNMVKASIYFQTVSKKKAYGKMGLGLNGLQLLLRIMSMKKTEFNLF